MACIKHIQTHIVQRKLVNFQGGVHPADTPDLTSELAEKLGISLGDLNYCLKARMEKGLVKMKNFANAQRKFGYVYVLPQLAWLKRPPYPPVSAAEDG